ncbi:MAG: sulfatase-like hydrolase/transferase [Bacteroidia bacterium]|nr:sulfatase-like hydrolase/transferase [Bacteroidia bacterium]
MNTEIFRINNRSLIPWLVGASLIEGCTLINPSVEAGKKPNVIIILTDDHGALDAGCYGSTDLYTPAIDRLAENGIRFTQAYGHTVSCPARAMMLTGRQPQRSGITSWTQGDMNEPKGRNMPTSEVTLAEVFQAAGYRTGIFGKWHLGAHPDNGPTKQGFDEVFGLRDGFIDNYVHYQLHRTGFHDLYEGDTEVFHRGEYFPDLMTDRAISFIARNQNRPFFLYYAMNIPHYPEQSLDRYLERYRDMSEPRRSYAAMVSTTDHYIDMLMAQLEALKLKENTIVVFMSDNGFSTEEYQIEMENHLSGYPKGHKYGTNGGGGNTGNWIGSKGSFLEGGIRVPAILSYPSKLPGGVVRDQVITAMDWFPTILELCNIPVPKGVELDGHSILPLVANPSAASAYDVLCLAWQEQWMVREGNWKLLFNDNGGLGIANKPKLDQIHLANLTDMQPEVINYASEHPEIVEHLTSLYQDWIMKVTPKELLNPVESLP